MEALREKPGYMSIDKPAFGSVELGECVKKLDETEGTGGGDHFDRAVYGYLCDLQRTSPESVSAGSSCPCGSIVLCGA